VRNPVVTASVCNLMQAPSADRFRLLLARASLRIWRRSDHRRLPLQRLADFISLCAVYGRAETVIIKEFSNFPALQLTDRHLGPPPPIVLTAIGPKSAVRGEPLRWSAAASFILLREYAIRQNGLRCGGKGGSRFPLGAHLSQCHRRTRSLQGREEAGGRARDYVISRVPGYAK